ncbi:hypothetical protein [Bradyrhizobium sp. Tv2a-2]|uniref:hypothetical protein n=1 Tax=Bradyrhizobium sp. Tv2a-2 TaxID=113395 RepID=UPI00040BD14D|nr:hypothetical protein [Bradyrhizobium sp. Tv2a-2]
MLNLKTVTAAMKKADASIDAVTKAAEQAAIKTMLKIKAMPCKTYKDLDVREELARRVCSYHFAWGTKLNQLYDAILKQNEKVEDKLWEREEREYAAKYPNSKGRKGKGGGRGAYGRG